MRGLLAEELSDRLDFTLVDMEAGLEHLSRSEGTLRYVDRLLVVVEPYLKATETARRTISLARELGIADIEVLANKVRDEGERTAMEQLCASWGVPLLAVLPEDEQVRLADRQGRAPIDAVPDSPMIRALSELAGRLAAPVEV